MGADAVLAYCDGPILTLRQHNIRHGYVAKSRLFLRLRCIRNNQRWEINKAKLLYIATMYETTKDITEKTNGKTMEGDTTEMG